jgi:hypothetical protein
MEQDCKPIKIFCSNLKKDGWLLNWTELYCPDYGDSVASRFRLIVGVHKNTQENAKEIQFRTPPKQKPPAMASYMWLQFNTRQYAVSFAKDDSQFNKGVLDGAPTVIPSGVPIRVTEAKTNDTVMFTYCRTMCKQCPGCALANGRVASSSELYYGFPITAPFNVLFVDGYSAGDHSSFDGHRVHLLACNGMTGFAVSEPVRQANSKTFAKSLMKIMLRYGICFVAQSCGHWQRI